jgi:nucleolar protein 56
LKGQIEERLNFLSNGGTTAKNVDAMAEVMEELKTENLYFQSEGEKL